MLVNALNAWGKNDLQTQLPSFVNEYQSGGAITLGSIVAIATDGTGVVTQAATGTTASLCIGIAIDAAPAAGRIVRVVTHGYARARVTGTPTAGAVLKRSGTTAAVLEATATPALGEALAVAIGAASSGMIDAWVQPGR